MPQDCLRWREEHAEWLCGKRALGEYEEIKEGWCVKGRVQWLMLLEMRLEQEGRKKWSNLGPSWAMFKNVI